MHMALTNTVRRRQEVDLSYLAKRMTSINRGELVRYLAIVVGTTAEEETLQKGAESR